MYAVWGAGGFWGAGDGHGRCFAKIDDAVLADDGARAILGGLVPARCVLLG